MIACQAVCERISENFALEFATEMQAVIWRRTECVALTFGTRQRRTLRVFQCFGRLYSYHFQDFWRWGVGGSSSVVLTLGSVSEMKP
jgi:hypothetical protein